MKLTEKQRDSLGNPAALSLLLVGSAPAAILLVGILAAIAALGLGVCLACALAVIACAAAATLFGACGLVCSAIACLFRRRADAPDHPHRRPADGGHGLPRSPQPNVTDTLFAAGPEAGGPAIAPRDTFAGDADAVR